MSIEYEEVISSILDIFHNEFPDKKVLQIVDFDPTTYVICALGSENVNMNPYFAFNKETQDISEFNVLDHFHEYWRAVDISTIYEN